MRDRKAVRIAVIGAGAVGSVLGSLLWRASVVPAAQLEAALGEAKVLIYERVG